MRIPQFIAKGSIAVLAGLAIGYYMGVDLAHDGAKGKNLTMKEYVDDFESYKARLQSSPVPMSLSLFAGVVLTLVTFGTYELLAAGLAKGIAVIDRRFVGPHVGAEPS